MKSEASRRCYIVFAALSFAVTTCFAQTPAPIVSASNIHIPPIKLNKCVQVNSSGSSACKDAGNVDSTCATARCPTGYTLTGGGGACAAGDRKIKSLFPRLDKGEFTIACEAQGVDPQANAICCKL